MGLGTDTLSLASSLGVHHSCQDPQHHRIRLIHNFLVKEHDELRKKYNQLS